MLEGYHRTEPSSGVVDRLYATILVLEAVDGDPIALLAIDHIGLLVTETDPLRKRVGETLSVDEGRVMVCFSHTHSEPRATPTYLRSLSERVERFFEGLPHPFITRGRLREILAPRPGERVLEVGPGAGYYALPVARWLEPGALDVLDVQQKMLDYVQRRAAEDGIANVVPTQADAQALPYPDASFDAAYLTLVLGEVPDQDRALQELRRVLKPGGRLVVGELLNDPHYIPFGSLRERAEAAGLVFERRVGSLPGYFARFRVP